MIRVATASEMRDLDGRAVAECGISSLLLMENAGAETARSKVEKIHALRERFPDQDVYWYVGDTAGDVREAREAGATPLGVAWGWHEPEMLLEAGAERIAATPAELLTILAPELAHDFFGG